MGKKELLIGIPRETMLHEGRIPLLPAYIEKLKAKLNSCSLGFIVERGLGKNLGIKAGQWRDAGATIASREQVYETADIILKVKQPFPDETYLYRKSQWCVCFHHAATNRPVVDELLAKGVTLIPFEYHRQSLAAMSAAAGMRIHTILKRLVGNEWENDHIFLGGGRGIVCQYAIFDLLALNIPSSHIHACDISSGMFVSPSLGIEYSTFSSADDQELCMHLRQCGIVILAALARGSAPKFILPHHLDLLPDKCLIIQVSIDEGGNIADPAFTRVTYWDKPVYEIRRGKKTLFVCNIPDIPGCIWPEESTRQLVKANMPFYANLFASWPDAPERYRLKV